MWQRWLWDRRRISTGTGLLIADDPACPAGDTCKVVFEKGEYPAWDAPEPSYAEQPQPPLPADYARCRLRVIREHWSAAFTNEANNRIVQPLIRSRCDYLNPDAP